MYRQRSDGRDGDYPVPPEWNSSRSPSRPASNTDTALPGQQGDRPLVQNLHVGHPLPSQQQPASLVGNQRQDVQCSEDLKKEDTLC